MALSYNLGYQESISVHPTRHQNFAGKVYSNFPNIWEWLLYAIDDTCQEKKHAQHEKQNDRSLPLRPMSKKSSLCVQYHLFQHSVQNLLGQSSMIFLCNKVPKSSKTAETENLSSWFAFFKLKQITENFLKSGWVKRFHQSCKNMMLNKPKIFTYATIWQRWLPRHTMYTSPPRLFPLPPLHWKPSNKKCLFLFVSDKWAIFFARPNDIPNWCSLGICELTALLCWRYFFLEKEWNSQQHWQSFNQWFHNHHNNLW